MQLIDKCIKLSMPVHHEITHTAEHQSWNVSACCFFVLLLFVSLHSHLTTYFTLHLKLKLKTNIFLRTLLPHCTTITVHSEVFIYIYSKE